MKYYIFSIDKAGNYRLVRTVPASYRLCHAVILAAVNEGHEIFSHAGEVVGRNGYPVNPSPELQAALNSAGVLAYVTNSDEREVATAAGIPF